jgi:DNA-binding CsgD family transcriptional regulator
MTSLLARIERICAAATDPRSLRLDLLEELRPIGFDAYSWLLTDPRTQVGWAPIADIPDPDDLARLIRLKYLTPTNRWTSLGADPVASLVEATGDDLTRSLLWRELLSGYAVRDVASIAFGDASGCWSFLDLWRYAGDEVVFTADELALLRQAVAPITTALRRNQAAQFKPVITPAEQPAGPIVLLLSPQLRLLGQTPQTDSYLRALLPSEDGRAPIPAAAFNVAAQLLAREQGVDDNAPSARVHLQHGQWLTLRAARIGGDAPGDDRATEAIAVTIEGTSDADRFDLFARTAQLSRRETELLQLLVTGIDTHQIATQMMLSELTVQGHFESIFTKTATRTRRQLVARTTGI